MLLKGEFGGSAFNSHGNYIVDHGKSWKHHDIVFLNFCGNPDKGLKISTAVFSSLWKIQKWDHLSSVMLKCYDDSILDRLSHVNFGIPTHVHILLNKSLARINKR